MPASLTVDDIAAASDVSRPSFYEHFASMDAVLTAVARRFAEPALADAAADLRRVDRTPEQSFGACLTRSFGAAAAQRPVFLAAAAGWSQSPVLRDYWHGAVAEFAAQLSAVIERDRAANIAPGGADPARLAAALAWGTERAFHLALVTESPASEVTPEDATTSAAVHRRDLRPPDAGDAVNDRPSSALVGSLASAARRDDGVFQRVRRRRVRGRRRTGLARGRRWAR